MQNLAVDFTWQKASSYEVLPWEALEGVGPEDGTPMQRVEWDSVESFAFEEGGWGRLEWGSSWGIAPNGPLKSFNPSGPVLDWAVKSALVIDQKRKETDQKNSAEGELEFRDSLRRIVPELGKRFGLLGRSGSEWEGFGQWIDLSERIGNMFDKNPPVWRDQIPVAHYSVFLVRRGNVANIAVRPNNMREAIALHAVQSISRGAISKLCQGCGSPFLAGGGTGKKADARFCHDKCRWTYRNRTKASTRKPASASLR